MWQSGKMKKLRRILAGWLCVILAVSLNISSLAEKGGQITDIIPTLSSEDKKAADVSSAGGETLPTETLPVEMDPAGNPEEDRNTSSVILHTPSNTGNTEQDGESDTSDDPEDEATPSDADEELINDLIDIEATPSDATPGDADLIWSVEDLQKRIDALPAASELEDEELGDFLLEVYREVVDIREAVESLSEDEQALLDVGKLEELETFFAEAYPAVFAAESGVLVDTGIMNETLRWGVYEKSFQIVGQGGISGGMRDGYSLVFTWEGDSREGVIDGQQYGRDYMSKYASSIYEVIFPTDGSIDLASYGLREFKNVYEFDFPDSIRTIGDKAIILPSGESDIRKITLSGSTVVSANAFVDVNSLKQKDLPLLNQLIFTNGSTERGSIGAGVFKNTVVQELIFPDMLKEIGANVFSNNKHLNVLDLGSVEVIGERAFANCANLRNIEIPVTVTTIGSQAFSGCDTKKMVFRMVTDAGLAEDAIELPVQSSLVIGKETKTLTGPLLNGLHQVSIIFEPENTIIIGGITDSPVAALNGLDGICYVDGSGVLYTEDRQTLIYCPPGIRSYTVPETVTAVGDYAFCQAKDLETLSFASPETVTSFGTRAFFGCSKLARINNQTTVAAVKESFPGCSVWTSQIFVNTALTDAPRTGGTLQKAKIELQEGNGDAILTFGFTPGAGTTETENGFENLTGDIIRLEVNAQGPNAERHQYRIYMEASDESCNLALQVDETVNLGQEGNSTPVTLKKSDTDGVYYLEFTLNEGSTASFDITPLYGSPVSAGGTLTIWGAILTEAEADDLGNGLAQDGEAAQRTEWKTVRNNFSVEKTAKGATLNNGLALRGDGTETGNPYVTVNGQNAEIAYQTQLKLGTGSGSQDSPYGKDYVKQIKCRDHLILPAGMHWRQEILDAIQAGDWYVDTSGGTYKLYYRVRVAGVSETVATFDYQNSQIFRETTSHMLEVSGEDVTIGWDLLNPSTIAEMPSKPVNLTINGACLSVNLDDPQYGWDTEQTLTNHITYELQYSHSDPVIVEASADLPIAPAKVDISIEKESQKPYLFTKGEDNPFKITLMNQGAIPARTLVSLEDTDLPKAYYIRPENIARMFTEGTLAKRMKLTITEATLYNQLELGTATAIDGTTMVPVTVANSSGGVKKSDHAALVFTWSGENLVLSVFNQGDTNTSPDGEYPIDLTKGGVSVQEALDQAGYLVTYFADYNLEWNLEETTLYAGQAWKFTLYTTAKDTFQFIQIPWHHEEDVNGTDSLGTNTVKVNYRENGEIKNKTSSVHSRADRDFRIDKSIKVNGAAVTDNAQLGMGERVEYTLEMNHWGEGDRNHIPLIDYMTGPQQLMVPAAENQGADWAKTLEPETIDGAEYYILTTEGGNTGEYKNVWIGTDESGAMLCADSVMLKREDGQLKTTITWYYHNLTSGSYRHRVTYKARLKATEADKPIGSLYWLNNEVWLNGRDQDYLFDHVGLFVLEFEFGKKIVVSSEESPEQLAVHSAVKKGENVKYKLNLDLYSNVTNGVTVTGAYDVLPDTHGEFEWTADKIKISYADGTTGDPMTENFIWKIERTDSKGQVSEDSAKNTYYTIRWDQLEIPLTNLVIYVELQFPEDAGIWDSYVTTNAGEQVFNDFYIDGIQRRVSHELAQTARSYLQKGVYRIGHFSRERGLSTENVSWLYRGTNTRTYYYNEDGSHPNVAYYIQVYNGGNSRLYLTEIQDLLPKGFTLDNGQTSTGYIFGTKSDLLYGRNAESNTAVTQFKAAESGDFSGIADSGLGDRIYFKSATVTVHAQDDALTGRQKLKFTFSKGESTPKTASVSYDPDRNLCYLEKGQAVAFAYTCYVDTTEKTDDYAENVVAMPYLDYSGGGVEAAEGVTGEAGDFGASDPNGTAQGTLEQNTGLCDVKNNNEAMQKGFFLEGADGEQKWLQSEVIVERGGIVPGITKTVNTYTSQDGSIDIPYTNGAGPENRINWGLTFFNNGEVPLLDYTVKDTMEYPYTFTGDVKYQSYTMTGRPWMKASARVGPEYLFTIAGRTVDSSTGQITLQVKDNSSDSVIPVPVAETEETAQWMEMSSEFLAYYTDSRGTDWWIENGQKKYQLRFYMDGVREVMEIHMSVPGSQLLAGGYATLELSTKNETVNRPYKIYVNKAVLEPIQLYEADRVTQGMNVTDITGKNAGVRNSAPVVIAGAYATSSLKTVEEDGLASGQNKADSDGQVNFIVLPDKEKEFTYTLTVNNNNTGKYSIGSMVFIDNLPQIGDHATFSTESDRGSQFEVSLADNPDVKVWIEYPDGGGTKQLDASQYTVEYTEKTEFEDADWDGNGTDWTDVKNDAARSLRVMILPTEDETLIPERAKISVTFNARITGEAGIGSIAWNSFGYRYSMIGQTPKLLSAPAKVGVKMPEVPILEKRLITVDNEEFSTPEDQEFRFLVHKGARLDGVDYNDEIALMTVLSTSGAPEFMLASVTVNQGASSGQTLLAGIKRWTVQQTDGTLRWVEDSATDWTWTDRTQYTIAELTPHSDYQFFRLYGSTTNGVSFYHQDASPIRLDCENRYPGWSILLKKVDSKVETTLLPGAVFAFYSPLESDQIQEGDAAYDAYLALSESERPAMTFAEPGTSGGAGDAGATGGTETTWYLADIRTTGESGVITWDGLSESAYRLKEVRAPEGYQITDTGYIPAVKPERQEGNTDPLVLTISVKNTSAFVLPKTGGTGTLPVNLAGILCLCYSGFLYKKKRAGVFTQKEKGGQGK